MKTYLQFNVTGACKGCKKHSLGLRGCPDECFHLHFKDLKVGGFKSAIENMFIASGYRFSDIFLAADDGEAVYIQVKKRKKDRKE